MAGSNHTSVIEFLLVGLTDGPELQMPLFVLFLIIYLVTLVGNVCMILLIQIDATLHTPMYFFLCNLALCDICYSTVLAPKMLINFLLERKSSSFTGCVFQSLFFGIYVTTEGFLLAVMAYDRYRAIVNPLLYTAIMTQKICFQLVLVSYLGGLANSLTHTTVLLRLNFCGPNVINHFFRDIPALLKLSCSDSHFNELLLLSLSGVIAIATLLIIVISYIRIVTAILRIGSVKGRYKTFSTCASHLTAVILFYSSLSFSYIQPSSQYSLEQEKASAVVNTLVIPMLNPLIYSLRNKDVKEAMKRSIKWKNCHH
ncbi:olfactory receptor 1052-like [Tachyglossus aculeatus]|uniref:olfactory receptor 1052-like n=1 Tax=Tachyglossus aculeatus TaxID=9261 RepID=UPI0018F695B2|nr:olfactory receptor 1052-like [Tachyglossus aculeatus]